MTARRLSTVLRRRFGPARRSAAGGASMRALVALLALGIALAGCTSRPTIQEIEA